MSKHGNINQEELSYQNNNSYLKKESIFNNSLCDIKESNNEINTSLINKDFNNIITPKLITNIKMSKENINNNTLNLNKYIEEKNSERNVLESFTLITQENLNFKKIEINNKNLNEQKTINFENNANETNKNNDNVNEIKIEKINSNEINKKNLSNTKLNTLIIKNKKRNIIKSNINNSSVNSSFSNNLLKKEMKHNDNNVEILYKCLFCGKYSSNKYYYLLFTCQHFFCMKCGKNFFEEIIDTIIKTKNQDIKIKCPIISCKNLIPLPLLQIILSEQYFDIIRGKIFKIKEKNKKGKTHSKINNNFQKTEIILETSELRKEKLKNIKKDLFNIKTKNNFIHYVKKTFIQCHNCKEYSLYGNIEGNYDLCLNCLKKYCKYCHKLFEERHFDRTYINHCRVVYRAFKDFSKYRCIKRYGYFLLYIILGYLFLLTFFLLKIKYICRNKNDFTKFIKIIFFLFMFILFLPFVIILFPYFPLITLI